MNSEDEKILRRIENEILDRQHRNFAIIERHEVDATRSLLLTYGNVLRGLRNGAIEKPNDNAKSETANQGLRAIGHCLRWIHTDCPSMIDVATPAKTRLNNESLELLRWGVDYDPLWNQHSAFSRGLIEATVAEPSKTITFLPKQDVHPSFFCKQIEAKKQVDERESRLRPDDKLAQLSREWYSTSNVVNGGLTFDDSTIRDSGALAVAADWMSASCLPELPEDTQLAGCTLSEVRAVLAALFVYGLFTSKLEDVVDDQHNEIELSTRLVSMPRREFVVWLSELSGVSDKAVDSIVTILTFDPDHAHTTCAHQPIISCKDGTTCLLPRMMMLLDLPKVYVGALNKCRSGRKDYARAIVEIEDNGVTSIAGEIRKLLPHTFQVADKPSIQIAGQKITPDLVLMDEHGSVVVIDVKYATPPFGPLDVNHDISEMHKWKARMSEYIEFLRNNPGSLNHHFQVPTNASGDISGLICLRWPLPIPVDFEPPITAFDWPSFKTFLSVGTPSSIKQIVDWAVTRPDVPLPNDLVWRQKEVGVADWTYCYSVLAPQSK